MSRLRLGVNRPPHHDAEIDEWDLQYDEHEDGFPDGDGHVVEQFNADILRVDIEAGPYTSLTLKSLGCGGFTSRSPVVAPCRLQGDL